MVDVQLNPKNIVCIEYPAIVKNVDRMLQSLGGEQRISEIYSDPTRRMELRFRPEDTYCGAVCGDRVNSTYMLMKVRRRKKRTQDVSENANSKSEFKIEMEGVVSVTYKFRSLLDFQYLPMQKTSEGCYENLLPKIVPQGLVSSSWLDEKSPLFAVPLMYSRFDLPTNYHYRPEPTPRDSTLAALEAQKQQSLPPVLTARKRRMGYPVFVSYDEKEIPMKPFEQALQNLKTAQLSDDVVEKARKFFEERPVWSKAALNYYMGKDSSALKFILPSHAYYFTTGPWRTLWVRFSYDPRKIPAAKNYQVLDFRLKSGYIKYATDIRPKRSTHCYLFAPFKATPGASRSARIHMGDMDGQTAGPSTSTEDLSHLNFMFIPGHLPPYHQLYYQLCDIQVKEVQELMHSNDGKETRCHEKDGWLPLGAVQKCRDILSMYVKEAVEKLNKDGKQAEDAVDEEAETDDNEDNAEFQYPSDPDYEPMDEEEDLNDLL